MFARVVEFMMACWLAMSPFIFQHEANQTILWVNDFTLAVLIAVFSLTAYWPPLEKIHLMNLATGAWLIGFGWVSSTAPAEPAYQNHIIVGLFIMMFAILPARSQLPPRRWREYYEKKLEQGK